MEQLCDGMEDRIDGGIHSLWLMYKQNSQEEYWVFLFIDEHNAFNKENRNDMLWEVHYKCPNGIQLTFKCY